MDRFHIVVFNFERIVSFLENFDRIKNFRPDEDRVLILDCSVNFRAEKEKVIAFAHSRRWTVGKEIQFLRRRNWGIDQGARIDYITLLRRCPDKPKYIWQFQEHYLDLKSAWSIWGPEVPELAGKLKADTIPDGLTLDLDLCARRYQEDPNLSVVYADRHNIGIFKDDEGHQSFYVDGANFSVRTERLLDVFPSKILDSYKLIYDRSYLWTLFIELDIGRRLTNSKASWYDLATDVKFDSVESLNQLEVSAGLLHQPAEDFYGPIYKTYKSRFLKAQKLSSLSRAVRIRMTHSYLFLVRNARLRGKLERMIDKLHLHPLKRGIQKHIYK